MPVEEISKVVWMGLKSVVLVFCEENKEIVWMGLVVSFGQKHIMLDLSRADDASQNNKRVTRTSRIILRRVPLLAAQDNGRPRKLHK